MVYIVPIVREIHMKNKFSKKDIILMSELSKGKTYKEIARIMNVSPRTVEWRIRKITQFTGCRNKVEIANYFHRNKSKGMFVISLFSQWIRKFFQ